MSSPGRPLYAVRRAVDADQALVSELEAPDAATRKQLFGRATLGAVIETSLLALTATDGSRPDRVVGFAALDDRPSAPELSDRVEPLYAFLRDRFVLPRRTSTWLFLSHVAHKSSSSSSTSAGVAVAVLRHLLHAAFQALPHAETVLLVLPSDKAATLASDDALRKFFEPVASRSASSSSTMTSHARAQYARDLETFEQLSVFQCRAQATFRPTLHVRRARVEDHDDLEPILARHNAAVARQFGDFFLAELIKDQDAHNVCLVAENGRAVGLLAVSDELEGRGAAAELRAAALAQSREKRRALGRLFRLDDRDDLAAADRDRGGRPPAARARSASCSSRRSASCTCRRATCCVPRSLRGPRLGARPSASWTPASSWPDALILDVMLARLRSATA
ncbi:hypothetical protein PINS_up020799 [Pythium insidiosum]|nr:hypothetical protein PINS_up020799 [Pythium insidiosum]